MRKCLVLLVVLLLTGCHHVHWLPSPIPASAQAPAAVAPAPASTQTPDAGPEDPAVVQAFLHGTGHASYDMALSAFQTQCSQLLKHHDWDELEELYVEYEQHRSQFAADRGNLRTFFHDWTWGGMPNDPVDPKTLVDGCSVWMKARPQSPLPCITQAMGRLLLMWAGQVSKTDVPGEVAAIHRDLDEAERRIKATPRYQGRWVYRDLYCARMETACG
ncbi:MAG TPA: hypothetical protein VGO93_24945, partial [Candidatus Xenobia bacterium]